MNEKQISLLAAFLAAKVEYAVVGGVAVNAHGYVRATNDLDIFIRPTEENARAAFNALLALGVPLEGLTPADLLNDEENLRFGPEEDHIVRPCMAQPRRDSGSRTVGPVHLQTRPHRKQASGGTPARPRRCRRTLAPPGRLTRPPADPDGVFRPPHASILYSCYPVEEIVTHEDHRPHLEPRTPDLDP